MTDTTAPRSLAKPFVPADVRHGRAAKARQDDLEHSRTMQEVRQYAADNRERIDAEWNALECPPRTIAEHIERGRKQMGEKRWAELQAEWDGDARKLRERG